MPQAIKRLKKVRIHHEGTHILIATFIVLLSVNGGLYILFGCIPFLTHILLALSIILYAVMMNFFRCPRRTFEQDTKGVVIAPADGKIVVIEEVEESEYFHDRRLMISIFMNIINVHANWYPVEGTVKLVRHHAGRFMAAWLPKASTDNERSTIIIQMHNGEEVLVRQVAGAMARRIVTYAEEGEQCYIDEHLGFIKFGSRVDIYLPLNTQIDVKMGQRTVGNQTIIAHFK